MFLNFVVSSFFFLVIFSNFWFLAVSMISVPICWFNFRTPKRRFKSYRMLNVQWEVYKWRGLENWGVSVEKILGGPLCHVAT